VRIGINTRFLLKDKLEGLGRYTLEVFTRIVKKHPEHEFVFFFDRAYDSSFVSESNVKPVVVQPPARHPFLWYLWFEWALPKAIKKEKIDYFISPDSFLSLRVTIPQHLVIHDLAFEHYPEGIPSLVAKFYKKYSPRYANKANRIVTVSNFTKQDVVDKYKISEEKIDAIHNGVSVTFQKSSIFNKSEILNKYSDGKEYMVYVGAMHPRKNITRLLKSFDQFKKQSGSELKLILVGRKAWQNQEMEETYLEMSFKNDVVFTGRLSDEELGNVLQAAHTMIYIPYFEGFGLPVIEAQSCGTPVITSNTSSLPEVLGKGGLLVDPFDEESIVSAMIKITSSKELYNSLEGSY